MSSGPRPDLGGLEEDDNYFADEYTNPEVVEKGCYRTVCIEMEVAQLAVNTVLQNVRCATFCKGSVAARLRAYTIIAFLCVYALF